MEYVAIMYNELMDNGLFTQAELDLITCMNGYSVETFDSACRVRYGVDAEDLLGWNEDDDEDDEDDDK